MDETKMVLGYDMRPKSAVIGWYASEKFDGVRAYWDGVDFWTRSGNKISVPERLKCGLPSVHLDCEIWAGRGNFDLARVAVQSNKWTDSISIIVHDSPMSRGNWADRIEDARRMVGESVHVVQWRTVRSMDELEEMLADIHEADGEGIVLRDASEGYTHGRTRGFLKLKHASQFRELIPA